MWPFTKRKMKISLYDGFAGRWDAHVLALVCPVTTFLLTTLSPSAIKS